MCHRPSLQVLVLLGAALAGCGSVDVVHSVSPSPYRPDSHFWIEPIQSGPGPEQSISSAPAKTANGAPVDNNIDPASVDIEQANRVFRAAARARGLDVNLSDAEMRHVDAMEIRPALRRIASTGNTGDNHLTVIGPGVRTTVELDVMVVAPDGRTVDELRLSVTGPFYDSLESVATRVAVYLQRRGAGSVPPPAPR